MSSSPLVLVVDDDLSVADLFTSEAYLAGFRTIPPALNLKEFQSALAGNEAEIAFVDIILRTANALNYLRDIRRAYRQLRVIIITGHSDEKYVHQTLELGWEGMILKGGNSHREIAPALRAVAAGGTYFTPVIRHLDTRTQCRPEQPLSTNEWKLFDLLRRDFRQTEIARKLQCNRRNIERRVKALRTKLGLGDSRKHVNWRMVVVLAPVSGGLLI